MSARSSTPAEDSPLTLRERELLAPPVDGYATRAAVIYEISPI